VRGIRQTGRSAQGVTLMNVREDDRLSAVALVVESEASTSAVVADDGLVDDVLVDGAAPAELDDDVLVDDEGADIEDDEAADVDADASGDGSGNGAAPPLDEDD
jgi:DNA gyrase subunit A